tara:strand:+ start:4360 stop:4893 length:534 start_codon:yes stop_codon:yes gene_type:complete
MNKPEYVKYLSLIDSKQYEEYIDFIIFKENNNYNREEFFDGCKTFFLVERFEIKNNELCKKFFDISKDLTKVLNDKFGEGSIYNIQFSLLPPQKKIKPHYDTGLMFSLSHRIHLPIVTNNESIFMIGNQEFKFKVNQLIEINNKKVHSVVNKSKDQSRIHLIVDYLPLKYSNYLLTH